jgi:uncharacterized protein (TIGR01244 family)
MKRALGILIVGVVMAGCAYDDPPSKQEASPVVQSSFGSLNSVHMSGSTVLAAQPSAEDLTMARDAGYRTVINLRHEPELKTFKEAEHVKSLGMHYANIPWAGPGELNDEVFDRVRAALTTSEGPVFLHCSSGNRVGAVWIPFRVLDQGLSEAEAVAEAKAIGMRTPGLEDKALDYVRRARAAQ